MCKDKYVIYTSSTYKYIVGVLIMDNDNNKPSYLLELRVGIILQWSMPPHYFYDIARKAQEIFLNQLNIKLRFTNVDSINFIPNDAFSFMRVEKNINYKDHDFLGMICSDIFAGNRTGILGSAYKKTKVFWCRHRYSEVLTADTFIHELGHMLGASHIEPGDDLEEEGLTVMSKSVNLTRWEQVKFAQRSIDEIKAYIKDNYTTVNT